MITKADGNPASRVKTLDGLRGLAALVVVIHHSMLVSPDLAAAYDGGSRSQGWAWAMVYTPLHLLWAAPAPVYVFFVLSGYVLTRKPLQGAYDWRSYYPRRLVRLYLPVWAALALAALSFLIAPRISAADQAWWVNRHADPFILVGFLHDATLVRGAGWVLSPLWSLQWEVLFSLFLPVYVAAVRRSTRWAPLGVVGCLAISELGSMSGIPSATYLPMFGVGAFLAAGRDPVIKAISSLGRAGLVCVVVVGLLLLNASWYPVVLPGAMSLTLLGATILVALSMSARSRSVLGRPWCLFLGRISFSLYLTHEILLMTLVTWLHTTNPAIVAALTVPSALALAWLFHLAVESPAETLARWAGTRCSRRVRPSDDGDPVLGAQVAGHGVAVR